jgi:hypothetical protein
MAATITTAFTTAFAESLLWPSMHVLSDLIASTVWTMAFTWCLDTGASFTAFAWFMPFALNFTRFIPFALTVTRLVALTLTVSVVLSTGPLTPLAGPARDRWRCVLRFLHRRLAGRGQSDLTGFDSSGQGRLNRGSGGRHLGFCKRLFAACGSRCANGRRGGRDRRGFGRLHGRGVDRIHGFGLGGLTRLSGARGASTTAGR